MAAINGAEALLERQHGAVFNFFAHFLTGVLRRGVETAYQGELCGLSPGTAYGLGAVQGVSESAAASATGGLVALAGGELLGSASALIPATSAVVGPVLERGNGVLVAITPSGQVITGNLGTGHAVFAQRVGVAAANGELVSGAYVGTAFNSGGQIAVLNSMTFFGNQTAASPAVQTAVRAAIGAQ